MKKSEFKQLVQEAVREQLNEGTRLSALDEMQEIKNTLWGLIRELMPSQAKAKSSLGKAADFITKAISEYKTAEAKLK